MRKASISCLSIMALSASALPAFAHTGAGATFGFEHGFAHPLGGIDHLLAMISVGALAALIGGRALVIVPIAFLGLMIVGALIGVSGTALPAVELGIAASVVVLGGSVAAGIRPGVALAALLVGPFALFHGYAHGGEMPATAWGLGYFVGFVTATTLLHLAGISLGLLAGRIGPHSLVYGLRGAGGVAAAVGIVLVMRAV